MRTTIDIELELLDEVAKVTGEKSVTKAVRTALREYVRSRRVEELIAMAGKLTIEDNWREMEELELEEMRRTEKGEW